MTTSYDVIVIGAGVIGCAVGRELVRQGARVAIIERNQPGTETSAVSVGCLVGGSAEEPRGQIEFLEASKVLYPDLTKQLYDETGIDIENICKGTILVAFDEFDQQNQAQLYHEHKTFGLKVKQLDTKEVRELEPAVTMEAKSALLYEEDGQVNNIKLVRALFKSALLNGVDFFHGTVEELLIENDTVVGVQIMSQEKIYAKWVVNAAGCWGDSIAGMPATKIVPAKGQVLILRNNFRDTFLRHVVMSPSIYIVPRPDGELRVGSTLEFVGFDKRQTAGAVNDLLSGTLKIVPSLNESVLADVAVGFRPCTPDFVPIIGISTRLKGLIFATGHHRYGVTLAPITALIVAANVTSRPAPVDYDRYRPDRFGI